MSLANDQRIKRAKHGPNIADVMLNKRIDEYVEIECVLTDHDWWPAHRRALVERRDHLRPMIERGLARCYPDKTPEEHWAFVFLAGLFREKPRTDPLGGGYVLTGSR